MRVTAADDHQVLRPRRRHAHSLLPTVLDIIHRVAKWLRGRWGPLPWVVCACLPTGSCDPVINVEGSFFPAWMLCIIVGIGLTALLRPLFVRSQLEAHLGPLPLVYSSLALLLTVLTWMLFFRT